MRSIAITFLMFTAAAGAFGSMPLQNDEPASWTLTCQAENLNTTDTSNRTAVIKLTTQAAAGGAIVHWKAPKSESWVTLTLRPVNENTWASRVDLGADEGVHQLQCIMLGVASSDGDKILARTYQLETPSFKLNETGEPEIWSQGKPRPEPISPVLTAIDLNQPAPVRSESVSPLLAAMIVFFINLMFAFAAGLALAYHRRHRSHRMTPVLLETRQRFAEAGIIDSATARPLPVEAESPSPAAVEKQDETQDLAADAVIETMNQAISAADGETDAVEPAEPEPADTGVEIRTTARDDEDETKIDMNDLSF